MPNEDDKKLQQLLRGKNTNKSDDEKFKALLNRNPIESQSQLALESDAVQQGFKGNSQYDKGLTFGSNQQNLRAANQPVLHEIANATVTGLANIIPQTLGNVAAIADIGDYNNKDQEIGNSISRAMAEWQQHNPLGLGKEDLPVYKPENAGIGTHETWTEAIFSDLVSSVGGFVLTGNAVGAGINAGLKGLSYASKANAVAQNGIKARGLIQGLNSLGEAGKAAGAVLEAGLLNHAEAITSAIPVYDDTYKIQLEKYQAEGRQDAEDLAKKDATAAGKAVIQTYLLTIPLNLTSSLAFLRTPNSTRALVKNPSLRTSAKNILSETGQESLEEGIGTIAEDKGYAIGQGKDYSMSDAAKSLASEKGVLSMLLGAVGGAAQTAGTQLGNKLNGNFDAEKQRFEQQKASIQQLNDVFTKNNVQDIFTTVKSAQDQIKLNNDLQESIDRNDGNASSIGQSILTQQSYSAFNAGTTQNLIDNYKSIGNMSKDEASQKGLDINPRSDDFYVKKSQEAISQIEKFEKVYLKINPNLPNHADVFNVQAQRIQLNSVLSKLNGDIADAQTELQAEKANRGVTTDLDNSNPITQDLQTYKELKQLEDQRGVLQDQAKQLDKHLDYIQSPKYEADQVELQKKEEAQASKPVEDVTSQDKQEASTFIAKDHTTPEEVQQDLQNLPEAAQVNPVVQQAAQDKIDNSNLSNLKVQDRLPETIQNGNEVVDAVRLTPQEQQLMGTTHTHVQINGKRFKFLSNNELPPIEKTLSKPESFLDYIGVNEDVNETIEKPLNKRWDSKIADEQNNRIGTVVRQFEIKYDESKKNYYNVKGKNGNPIEIQNPTSFNFKLLNSPSVNVGTEVVLTYGIANYNGEDVDTVFVNIQDEKGKLTPITQMHTEGYESKFVEPLINRVKTEGKIVTTIVDKKSDYSNAVTTSNNSSLTDLALNSPQHLPHGKIYIAQNFNDKAVVSNIPGLETPVISDEEIKGIKPGRSAIVMTSPLGKPMLFYLFQPKSKDIEINGKKASKVVIDEINQFIQDNHVQDVDWDTKGLKGLKSDFEFLKDKIAQILDIGRRPWNTFNLGFDVNPQTKDVELYLNVKGNKTFDRAAIDKAIGERPMAIRAEDLESNKPISVNGVDFPSFVDFVIQTKSLVTDLYTKQPFRDARLKLSTTQILDPNSNEVKRKLGVKYGEPTFRLNVGDLNPDEYQVWDRNKEIEWLKRNLPSTPAEVLANTIDLYEKFGQKAFGAFHNGVIYLANNTESGTAYHEAFHAVFQNYLNSQEKADILSEGTEEEIAEKFRAYVLTRGEIGGSSKTSDFFKQIYHWIIDLLGLDKLNNLFYKIDSGKFANSPVNSNGLNNIQVQSDVSDSIIAATQRAKGDDSQVKEYFNELSNTDDIRKPIFESVVQNFDVINSNQSKLSPIQKYFKTIPSGELNALGFNKPVDYDKVKPVLSELLGNANTAQEIQDIITTASVDDEVLGQIAEDMNKDESLKDVFFNEFSTVKTPAQRKLDRLKGNIGGDLDKLINDPYYSGSRLVQTLAKDHADLINFANLSPVDTGVKFESVKNGVYYPYQVSRQSSVAWNIPTLSSNSDIFDQSGVLNKSSDFYNWIIGDIQAEYSRIKNETFNKFKEGFQPENGYHVSKLGGVGLAYSFNNYPFLNELLWTSKPSKFQDVNIVDLKPLDVTSDEFNQLLNKGLSDQFQIERKKSGLDLSQNELDNFVAQSMYGNVEISKITLGDLARIGNLEQIAQTTSQLYQTPSQSKKVPKLDIAQVGELLLQSVQDGNPIPNSLEVAYTLINVDGEEVTNLPIDFPSITEHSQSVILGDERSLPKIEGDYSDIESKYRGKKYWWSPSYQEFLQDQSENGKLNVNPVTQSAFKKMKEIGGEEVAVLFVNQPIIKNLVASYNKTGDIQKAIEAVSPSPIELDELSTFEPKLFNAQDLRDSLKSSNDELEVLKAFLHYTTNIAQFPQNSGLFSEYSPLLLNVQTSIETSIGKKLNEQDRKFINQEFNRYLFTHPDSYFGTITREEKIALINDNNPLKSANLITQELWDKWVFGDPAIQQQVEDFVKYDYLKNGFNSGIHSNFYIQLSSNEFFRNIKRTFDVADPKIVGRFMDQFMANNYKSLPYLSGDPNAINKPLYLVSNNNLYKLVDGKYVVQDTSSETEYQYGEEINYTFPETTNTKVEALEQSLIEDGVQVPYNATEDEVIFEWRKYCNGL